MIYYKGIDQRGAGHTGATEVSDLVSWVKTKYDQGFRSLRVWRGVNQANAIAEITSHTDTGWRVWWAEV
jgi:hypothetical protein